MAFQLSGEAGNYDKTDYFGLLVSRLRWGIKEQPSRRPPLFSTGFVGLARGHVGPLPLRPVSAFASPIPRVLPLPSPVP